MAATKVSIYKSLPAQFHNIFEDVVDHNNFCFHSINPSLLFPELGALKSQNLVFSEQYSNTLDISIFTGRYTIGCNVIFQNLDAPKSWPF